MKILMRNQKNGKWQLVQSAAYGNEGELQKLLHETPSLVSIEEARQGAGTLVTAVREFPLDIGSIDLVGFTAAGDIAVVECKLAANEEIKRKVIGQVFEYGANLWGMSYQELDQKVLQRSGQNLADLVHEAVSDPEWDEEAFRANVEYALENGQFILVIVVDEINEGLSRIVRFINDAGKPAFSLAALEMRRFQKEQTEILVPHLYGAAAGPQAPGRRNRKHWNWSEFYEAAKKNLPEPVALTIKDLYDWSLLKAKRVWFGTGATTGSFTFHYLSNGKTVSMFSVYTDGTFMINYGWIAYYIDQSFVPKLHQAIITIPGFEQIPAEFNKFPSVKIEEVFVNKPDALAQFKKVIEDFGKEL